MPSWTEKAVNGTLICLVCGSLVIQIGQYCSCTNIHCYKHDDIPVEQSRGFGGGAGQATNVTISGTTVYSTSTTTTS